MCGVFYFCLLVNVFFELKRNRLKWLRLNLTPGVEFKSINIKYISSAIKCRLNSQLVLNYCCDLDVNNLFFVIK